MTFLIVVIYIHVLGRRYNLKRYLESHPQPLHNDMLAIWAHILRLHASGIRCQFCHKGFKSDSFIIVAVAQMILMMSKLSPMIRLTWRCYRMRMVCDMFFEHFYGNWTTLWFLALYPYIPLSFITSPAYSYSLLRSIMYIEVKKKWELEW